MRAFILAFLMVAGLVSGAAAASQAREPGCAPTHKGGKFVAHANPDTMMSVVLADENGRVLSEADVGAEQILTHVSWLSETVLLVGEHRNPNYSQLHLLRVEPGGRLKLIPRNQAPGIACVVAPSKVARACPSAEELSEAQIKLRSIRNWDGVVARPARPAPAVIDADFNGKPGRDKVLEPVCGGTKH
jgi:hypothetical protein